MKARGGWGGGRVIPLDEWEWRFLGIKGKSGVWRHDIHHNDIRQNDTKQNGTQYDTIQRGNIQYDVMLSGIMLNDILTKNGIQIEKLFTTILSSEYGYVDFP